jgi:DNA-binding LacI/PurR family transcriptional regulator
VLFRGPDEDPLDHLHRIVSRRIADGIIITELAPGDARIPFLEAAGVDFVAFGRSGDSDHAWVDFDFESVARVTARQFTTTGHHRLAVVLNDLPLNHNRILESGFRAEARRAGLPDAAVEIWRTRNGALDQAQRARLAAPDAPTGFLAGNDTIAASLYAGLAAAGHAVGRDAAVVSAFPVLSLQGLSPPLSCFVADLDAVGVALARQLGARLRESPAERRDLPPDRIPLRFDPRGSETCHRCQTERRQSLTHAPLRPDERTQASTKATPASPSAMSG